MPLRDAHSEDGMHPDIAGWVLQALDQDDAMSFAAHLRNCEECRGTVERAFNRLRQHRAVATRYDKRDFIYRGTVDVAAIRIWLRDPVP